ncbi:Universal stress protein family [Carex littledalei]|uniref:Universal stress protein family n=1 Tax=Carex littledalei TaxID=544730 RepID=A0A833QRF1_9POAL|nr:Universal stress protein family [Carex littledalei]
MDDLSNGDSFLRQLSVNGGEMWDNCSISSQYKSTRGSKRWGKKRRGGENAKVGWSKVEEVGKKRVMVVIDQSSGAKHAMMWALTHVTNKGDLLTLIHVMGKERVGDEAHCLVNSLGSLCKACKPEVEVEALVIQGPKLATIFSQVKKLEVSVLVLSQYKPSPFCCWINSSKEEFVEECINRAECLTLAVRKQSKGVGGYLVSTRWQKNFWLLA